MANPEDTTGPSRSYGFRRVLWWGVAALGVVALVVTAVRFVRWQRAKDSPMHVCQSLEKTGAVAKCVEQRRPVVYGVQANEVVRFEVRYEGHRAYLGTLVRLRDEDRLQQFLRLAAEVDRKSARKTAAAAEIGSGGKLSGASIVAELAPIQIANLGRRLAANLKPVYGGPKHAVTPQIAAIRAQIMQ